MPENRATYYDIKRDVLNSYYYTCLDLGFQIGRDHQQVFGLVTYDYETAYEDQIENLMLQVVFLVLSGNWYEHATLTMRKNISEILNGRNITDFLSDIPIDEKDVFLRDFNVVMKYAG